MKHPAPRPLLVVLALSASLQLILAALPDTMGDLLFYRLWARSLVTDGLSAAYWPPPPEASRPAEFHPPVDYPPVFPYVLRAMGAALRFISPSSFAANDRLLDFLIRLPLVLSNLVIAALIFVVVKPAAGEGAAVAAAAFHALNPAVLFHTCYWGQTDALSTMLVLAALASLVRGAVEWSFVLVALAALTKPLAYPFVPVVALATLKLFGAARLLRGAAAAAVAAMAVLFPFLWTSRLPPILKALFVQLDAMPYVSVNAHNLWWLLGMGLPWTDARERVFGPISYGGLALAMFSAFLALTLKRLWRSEDPRAPRLAAASVALGFFILATHMHENHLFPFLPLLASLGLEERRRRRIYLLVSATFLANMALHDPFLAETLGRHSFGPRIAVPQPLSHDPVLSGFLTAHGYRHLLEEAREGMSLPRLALTLVNSQLNLLAFAYWVWTFYTGRSFDPALQGARPSRVPRGALLTLLALLVLAGFSVMFRLAHLQERVADREQAAEAPSRWP